MQKINKSTNKAGGVAQAQAPVLPKNSENYETCKAADYRP
jgi:hypothetical protein